MLVTDAAAVETLEGKERLVAAIQGGTGIVQLRDRSAGAGELLARARALRRLLPDTPLVVNDRVDVALAAGADGVHLGGRAMPAADARRLLGARALIGRSVHSAAEAASAEAEGADYLVVGMIYPSDTHPGQSPAGPELLEAVAVAVRIPFYAIGGITPATAGECVHRGAHGIAVIRAISDAPDPEDAARRLDAALQQASPDGVRALIAETQSTRR